MFALGGFLLAALLVLTASRGVGYHGQFVADAFSSFVKILVLAGAALALILSLDYNRKNHIARFEFPVLMLLSVVGMMVMVSAVEPDDAVSGARAAVAARSTCWPPSRATNCARPRPA